MRKTVHAFHGRGWPKDVGRTLIILLSGRWVLHPGSAANSDHVGGCMGSVPQTRPVPIKSGWCCGFGAHARAWIGSKLVRGLESDRSLRGDQMVVSSITPVGIFAGLVACVLLLLLFQQLHLKLPRERG